MCWFAAISPVVQELVDLITDLDHSRQGRVVVNEQRLEKLEAWSPTVVRH